MRLNKILAATVVAVLLTGGVASQSLLPIALAQSAQTAGSANLAVEPQYDTTHVCVAPKDFGRFVASLRATFGGTTTNGRRHCDAHRPSPRIPIRQHEPRHKVLEVAARLARPV